MRRVVGALAGIEILAGFAIDVLFSGGSDPLGAAIGKGVIGVTAVPLCVCAIPALFVAWRGHLPYLGLALVAAAPPLWLYLMARA